MRAKEARLISIGAFLKSEGFNPTSIKNNAKELWYNSPLRSGDSSPSFKVNVNKNLWFDFWLAKGGNALDLVCELKKLTIKEALAFIDSSYLLNCPYSVIKNQSEILPAGQKEKHLGGLKSWEKRSLEVLKICPIENSELVDFLQKRKITLTIARKYASEIHFKPPRSDKIYFGVGLSCGDGFEVRNKLFKGFVWKHKDLIKINLKNDSSLSIFEGFMDFLAFLSFYQKDDFQNSVIILNSVSLKKRALQVIQDFSFSKIYLFLDNDEAWSVCKQFFLNSVVDVPVVDNSGLYNGFKDFNDMVMKKG